jgi:hypothetical protein
VRTSSRLPLADHSSLIAEPVGLVQNTLPLSEPRRTT